MVSKYRIKLYLKREMNMQKLMKQIIRFAAVGGSAFVIDYGILFVLNSFLGMNHLVASTISFSVSVIYNYVLSTLWVFDVNEEQSKSQQLTVFMVLSVIGLAINEFIMWICVDNLKMMVMVGKIIATAVVMVYNFITRKIYLEK